VTTRQYFGRNCFPLSSLWERPSRKPIKASHLAQGTGRGGGGRGSTPPTPDLFTVFRSLQPQQRHKFRSKKCQHHTAGTSRPTAAAAVPRSTQTAPNHRHKRKRQKPRGFWRFIIDNLAVKIVRIFQLDLRATSDLRRILHQALRSTNFRLLSASNLWSLPLADYRLAPAVVPRDSSVDQLPTYCLLISCIRH
jgi:hypothetical protein